MQDDATVKDPGGRGDGCQCLFFDTDNTWNFYGFGGDSGEAAPYEHRSNTALPPTEGWKQSYGRGPAPMPILALLKVREAARATQRGPPPFPVALLERWREALIW